MERTKSCTQMVRLVHAKMVPSPKEDGVIMNKTFWGKDKQGSSHTMGYSNGHTQASCNVNVVIVSVRFTDQPDNPCKICSRKVTLPKAEPVLIHEDRKQGA